MSKLIKSGIRRIFRAYLGLKQLTDPAQEGRPYISYREKPKNIGPYFISRIN